MQVYVSRALFLRAISTKRLTSFSCVSDNFSLSFYGVNPRAQENRCHPVPGYIAHISVTIKPHVLLLHFNLLRINCLSVSIKMGQSSTKPESPQPQHTPVRERRSSSSQPDLTIQPQETFESNFTLISPMSELSNPSQFLLKRHHYNDAAPLLNVPPSQMKRRQNNKSSVVLRNVPPLPPALQQGQNKPKNEEEPRNVPSSATLKKEKNREKRSKKIKHIKEAFAGCAHVSVEHADKVRTATTTAFTACAKKTGEALQASALVCVKATKTAAVEGADVIVRTASHGCARGHQGDEEPKHKKMSSAARDSLSDVNDSDCVVFPMQGKDQPEQFAWREHIGASSPFQNQVDREGGALDDDATPLVLLDRAFAAAAGLHQEDDYFDRLARPTSSPSPFAKRESAQEDPLPDEDPQPTSINVSLFSSESSIAHLETSDVDFAREVCQPKWQRMTDYEITPSTKALTRIPKEIKAETVEEATKTVQERPQYDQTFSHKHNELKLKYSESANHARDTSTKDLGNKSATKITGQLDAKRKSAPGSKTTTAPVMPFERSVFRQKKSVEKKTAMPLTSSTSTGQSVMIKKRNGSNLRDFDAKPRVMPNRDYRAIALTTSDGAASPPAISRNYTACSPSASSTCSNGENSRGPLLTSQTLSNAAFLFSPSYAGDNGQLLKRQQPVRDPAFSISTFAARARLSSVSSRSQPAITIPVSKSWESSMTETTSIHTDEYCFPSKISASDSNSSKHVRFSDSNQMKLKAAAKGVTPPVVVDNEPRKEIFKPVVPEQILHLGIDTKLSDLTESSVPHRSVNFDAASILSATSILSIDQEHQETSPSASSIGGSEGNSRNHEISPSASSTDGSEGNSRNGSVSGVESTTSSKTQGSIHWAYREDNGKVTATPNLNRKRTTNNGTLPTTSPMVRFRAAKEKFANPSEKVVPEKRTPPKTFFNRTPRKTAVASQITKLDDRINDAEQPASRNPRRDTNGHQALAPYRANLVNPNFRAPTVSSDLDCENPREEVIAKLRSSSAGIDCNTSMSIADTDVSEDPFAEIIMGSNNYSNSEPDVPGARALGLAITMDTTNSVLSYGSRSTSVDLLRHRSQGTGSYDEESTVSLNYLHKMSIDRGQVKPSEVYKREHAVKTANLCLSPTQRTPMQARKWRTLAAAAHENEKTKKSTVKRGNRKAFSERNVNVQ